MSQDEKIACIDNDGIRTMGIITSESDKLFEALSEVVKPVMRSEAEGNPSYKQLITYVVIVSEDASGNENVLTYERISAKDERLIGMYSLGFGGHVTWLDDTDVATMVNVGLLNELEEELDMPIIEENFTFVGELHDDSTALGKEHLGIVYMYYLPEEHMTSVKTNEPDKISLMWVPIPYLTLLEDKFESWSKIALRAIE